FFLQVQIHGASIKTDIIITRIHSATGWPSGKQKVLHHWIMQKQKRFLNRLLVLLIQNNYGRRKYITSIVHGICILQRTTERVRISSPTLEWEQHGDLHDANNPPHVNVNEGPELLTHGDRMFLIYSASGCWTDFYALGMLSIPANGNLLDSASWTKNPVPVF